MGSNYSGPPAPDDLARRTSEGRMARGTRLAGEAFALLRDDRRLLLLPAAALLVDVVCVGVLLALSAAASGRRGHETVLLVSFAAGLYPVTVSSTFFNVALMYVVSQRWKGHQTSVRDGLLLAWQRLGTIVAWSLIAATVGAAMQLVQRVGHFAWIERLLAFVLNLAWSVATFFVLPALALEDIGPLAAVKRSSSVVRRRWPESVTGSIVIGGAAGLALIPGLLVCVAGVAAFSSNPGSGAILLMIGVAMALPVMLYLSATSAVFSLAVWEYANHGVQAGPFSTEDLQQPFRGGEQIGRARRWIGARIHRRAP
jgi:MFS family permease